MPEKQQNITRQRERQLQEPSPIIEKVSDIEVYLLQDGERTRRICGKQKANMPEGYVCLSKAGAGTEHVGYGYCSIHEMIHPQNKVSMWKRIREENPTMIPTIREALETSDSIEKKELVNIDNVIQMQQALLLAQLKTGEGQEWTMKRSEHIISITNAITKAIEAKSRIEKTISIEPKDLKAFIHQIFDIIKKNLDDINARKIMQIMFDEVIVPMNKDEKTLSMGEKLMEKMGVEKAEFKEE